MEEIDLFGNVIEKKESLADKYIEPPFSVLDARQGRWQARKNRWKGIGIKSELGRSASVIHMSENAYGNDESTSTDYVSIFDPVLCEVVYKWFCPEGGKVLDPFAGGSVRGIVAGYLGYKYVGVDIRAEQVKSNEEQRDVIRPAEMPQWICGDSRYVIDGINEHDYDLVFSCPPYHDLEVYSDLDGDISNMSYDNFIVAYKDIVRKSCEHLRDGGMAVFVVGEVRDKRGNYKGIVPITIEAFTECGMSFYNEAILVTPVASASMRAEGNMKTRKLVKTHQNVLCFRKV